jgi:hypothetical protein
LRPNVKVHLYEFLSKTRKLRCSCGWERTLKTADPVLVDKKFVEPRAEAARLRL